MQRGVPAEYLGKQLQLFCAGAEAGSDSGGALSRVASAPVTDDCVASDLCKFLTSNVLAGVFHQELFLFV